jgi:hypothetical protein
MRRDGPESKDSPESISSRLGGDALDAKVQVQGTLRFHPLVSLPLLCGYGRRGCDPPQGCESRQALVWKSNCLIVEVELS